MLGGCGGMLGGDRCMGISFQSYNHNDYTQSHTITHTHTSGESLASDASRRAELAAVVAKQRQLGVDRDAGTANMMIHHHVDHAQHTNGGQHGGQHGGGRGRGQGRGGRGGARGTGRGGGRGRGYDQQQPQQQHGSVSQHGNDKWAVSPAAHGGGGGSNGRFGRRPPSLLQRLHEKDTRYRWECMLYHLSCLAPSVCHNCIVMVIVMVVLSHMYFTIVLSQYCIVYCVLCIVYCVLCIVSTLTATDNNKPTPWPQQALP